MNLAALLLCIPSVAPQDFQDGVYTHKEREIRFTIPKDWSLRQKDFQWGWGAGTLTEFVSKDQAIGGVLFYEPQAMKVERYADAVEKAVSKLEGMKTYKKVKDEKVEGKKNGAWLIREYEMDYNGNDYRRVNVFINRGQHNFNFAQWCYETQWDECKAKIYKNIETLTLGDLPEAKPADDAPAAKPAPDKPVTAPAVAVAPKAIEVPEDSWKGAGVDSFVKYKTPQGLEMTYVLVEHKDGESYSMRTDMVMSGNKLPSQTLKFVVKKPEAGKEPEGEKPQMEQGEETIKVAKGEFKCKWTKVTTKQGWSKSWLCDDVPFRLVKSEGEYSGVKTALELVDFEKK